MPAEKVEPQTPYALFHVECDKGWKGLYQPLLDLCELKGNTVLQVKEKFGGLRFYWAGSYDITLLVEAAEEMSYKTCEKCGTYGVDWDKTTKQHIDKVTTGVKDGSFWIKSLCKDCRNETA